MLIEEIMEKNEIILDDSPKNHLFIASTEIIGANYLNSCFQKCKKVSVLEKDIELLFSPQMYVPPIFDNPNFFIKERELLETGSDVVWSNNSFQLEYNWQQINDAAGLRVGKSIYNFIRPHILLDFFTNCGFLFVTKNPYVLIQDFISLDSSLEFELQNLAEHALQGLIIQRKNNYLLGNNFAFTYEDMVTRPKWVEEKIKDKYEIEDFEFDFEEATSSEDQIAKFTDFQIDVINDVFVKAKDTLEYWGYDLIKRED
jgi:hypothetical protein